MKKILVPCDFSVPATQAFKFAAAIARQSKGEIVLLHIVELPVLRHGPVPINALEKSYLGKIKERITIDVDRMISKWGKGLKVSFVLDHGAVNNTIVRNIKKHKVDLIVMGTHGASGIREFILGSNAEKIVRYASVPVITVKKQLKNKFALLLKDNPQVLNKFTTDDDFDYGYIVKMVHLYNTGERYDRTSNRTISNSGRSYIVTSKNDTVYCSIKNDYFTGKYMFKLLVYFQKFI